MIEFTPLRAKDHRASIAPEFGSRDISETGTGLTVAEIMAHPKLAELAVTVWDQVREQFAENDEGAKQTASASEAEYIRRLEGVAEMLEILLEETLDELERFKTGQPHQGGLLV